MRTRGYLIGVLVLTACTAGRVFAAPGDPAPRSDGSVLHVDFEQYADGWVGPLNAGVRQLGDPFTSIKQKDVRILRDAGIAYEGQRCAYVSTNLADQRGRIILQRTFDAPEAANEAIEFMFRVTQGGTVDLEDFVVWSAMGYARGTTGITLYANGRASDGTYALDIQAGGDTPGRTAGALTGLPQREWIRFVLVRDRAGKTVNLWAGAPGKETWVGQFADIAPDIAIGRAEFGDVSSETSRGSGFWDSVRVGSVLGENGAIAAPESIRDLSKELPALDYPMATGPQRQLFVDDAMVESMESLQRVFHSVTKHPGNPVFKPELPWEIGGTWYVPFDVLPQDDGNTLRLWYGCYRRSSDKLTYTCVADSVDGLHWERLLPGYVEFEGSKENNIVWAGRGVKVNFDPRDPDPTQRYKGMTRVNGFTRMSSPDGLQWTMESEPAVTQAYDASSFHWDPVAEKWIASCKIWHDGHRARGYAESRDYRTWSDTCIMLDADEHDQAGDQLYAMWFAHYESHFIGLLKVYHVSKDRCDLQVAFSRDGMHWERPWREAFIPNSPEEGAYDFGNLDAVGDPIVRDGQLWFYYGGRSILHNTPPQDSNGSLCLATLRLDGFASLEAGETEGVLLTKPILVQGDTLFLNAEAQAGEIRVEIVDADNPSKVAGTFSRDACASITTDSTKHAVSWQGADSLDPVRGEPVRLRFTLRNAKLYSFWTE
ncbi:MAG: hypothetical protein IT365_16325 [Candidatus Hydrogenedentes bacterium]|nr:hypothetical protein [Candidatus Hydrogenedentota bacterium]